MECFDDGQSHNYQSKGGTRSGYAQDTGKHYSATAAAAAVEEISSGKTTGGHVSDTAALRPIPLICSICPKNTKFSDVSHLLTHISSKGHLSNMFKLDIAKYDNEDADKKLENYNAWFDEYNIRELLQNRSENRIQKGSSGRGRSGSNARGGTPTVSLRGGRTSMVSRNDTSKDTVTRGQGRVRDILKSTTRTNFVKSEPKEDIDPISNLRSPFNLQDWRQNSIAQSWSDLPSWNGAYFDSGFQQELGFGIDQPYDIDNQDEDAQISSKYEPSDNEDEDEDEDQISTSILPSDDTINTTVHDVDIQTTLDSMDREERERLHFRKYLKGEIATLEGVGGFDAAPEEQRRKRNQRKDPSVLVHMEASSKSVQTLEQVTDLDFNHIRWRDVYDDPSIDGSEDEGDEPMPVKKTKRRSPKNRSLKKTRGKPGRPRARAQSVTSRGSNVAASTRGRGRGRAARITRQASNGPAALRSSSTQESSAPIIPASRPHRSTERGFNSISNIAIPTSIRVGNRMVDVFRDNDESTPGSSGAPTIQQRQNNLPGLTLRPTNTANLSLLSPTLTLKRYTPNRIFTGKENAQSSFQSLPTTSNPYLNNPDSLGENPFNPLYLNQATTNLPTYSPWDEDTKTLSTGFQSIDSDHEYALHFTSHYNDNYYSAHAAVRRD